MIIFQYVSISNYQILLNYPSSLVQPIHYSNSLINKQPDKYGKSLLIHMTIGYNKPAPEPLYSNEL